MKTLDQLLKTDIKNKRVLVRCDFNVPMQKGKVLDTTRIQQHKKTIDALTDAGAKVLLLSHFGRPVPGKDKEYSLSLVRPAIEEVLGQSIPFIPSCTGHAAFWAARYYFSPRVPHRVPKKVLLLENTRFHPGDATNDEQFGLHLSQMGDIFVNDAFSVAHRAHASVTGIPIHLPSFAGGALAEEVKALETTLAKPARPSLAIIGGSKIAGKAKVLEKLLAQMDCVAIGGAMSNAFLAAVNKMPQAVAKVDDESITLARAVLQEAEKQGTKIILPVDMVCAKKLEADSPSAVYALDKIPPTHGCFDIGPQSVRRIEVEIEQAKTILWNGPLGAFEIKPFDKASLAIARKVAASTALSVAGGGETLTAIHQAGAAAGWTFLSTAGGAFLAWLQDKRLPALEALD